MRRILITILGLFLISNFSLKVNAQQVLSPDQGSIVADAKTKKAELNELKIMIDDFLKQEKSLDGQIKAEKEKVKALSDKLKKMRDDHKKVLADKSLKFGISLKK